MVEGNLNSKLSTHYSTSNNIVEMYYRTLFEPIKRIINLSFIIGNNPNVFKKAVTPLLNIC